MSTVTISVEKLRLYAHHGVHEEERIIGAEFEVDVNVKYAIADKINALGQTIDYTRVTALVRQEMARPRPLLETVCQDIIDAIKAEFPVVTGINITIRKITPPVVNFRGHLSVNIRKKYT